MTSGGGKGRAGDCPPDGARLLFVFSLSFVAPPRRLLSPSRLVPPPSSRALSSSGQSPAREPVLRATTQLHPLLSCHNTPPQKKKEETLVFRGGAPLRRPTSASGEHRTERPPDKRRKRTPRVGRRPLFAPGGIFPRRPPVSPPFPPRPFQPHANEKRNVPQMRAFVESNPKTARDSPLRGPSCCFFVSFFFAWCFLRPIFRLARAAASPHILPTPFHY